jgi:predicted ATPase
MIKRIRVQNFKSLRDVDLEFGTRNVLVGPNMSGKSNIIDVFRFLRSVVVASPGFRALQQAFQQSGGYGEVLWKGTAADPTASQVSIEVEGTTPPSVPFPSSPRPAGFSYRLAVSADRWGNVKVQEERLTLHDGDNRWDAIKSEKGERSLLKPDGTRITGLGDPSSTAIEQQIIDWQGNPVRQAFASSRFYRLVPALAKTAPNPSAAVPSLNEAGENLASWLMTIQTQYKDSFARVEMAMRDAFPEIESLFTSPTQQSTVFVSSRERFLRRPTSVFHMSDGEIAFLSLLSLIYAPPELGAPLFCIEEPENYLHPRLLEMLVQLLSQRQNELPERERATVIISTHSPLLVDQCGLDEIIVVEKHEGATVCTRPNDKAYLKELLEKKEMGLGNLFYSGALGGG